MPSLNINRIDALATLGIAGPVAEGCRFSISGKNWPADVQAWARSHPLSDGDTMHFRAANDARPGRPALVFWRDALHITCNPPPGVAVLAEAVGVDYEWKDAA